MTHLYISRITNGFGMTFAYVPPGTFLMGSPEDEDGCWNARPQHPVTLTRGYYLQTTPVTQGQWKMVLGDNPSYYIGYGVNCPVEWVSWKDCQRFIARLNRLEGEEIYRLPTEAEWEYACRAGANTRFCFGDDERALSEYVWFFDESDPRTHPVAQKKPNPWGLYDLHGNVWEWCEDWYGDYPEGPVTDPMGPGKGVQRVIRGGSRHSHPRAFLNAVRTGMRPGTRADSTGFRLLRLDLG